ncbi:MAG: PAS domain-containing protein [Herpetosiphonaceae bacterium]|nr:PAS domain-containing protein [Herpetosiphonaceae bacterium]
MTVLNEELLRVLEQGMHSTTEGITISDERQPDNPLIYANPAFYEMTGYSPEETIGYNCRFLQGPGTDREVVRTIKDALVAHERCVVEFMNYRKDGTPFWNRLAIVPIYDTAGVATHFVGIQADLTAIKEADKAKAQLVAMRATMQTVNDAVRNFMNNLQYFRFQIEDTLASNLGLSAEYEETVQATLATLTLLSSAQEYHDHEVLRGITGIDLDAIATSR